MKKLLYLFFAFSLMFFSGCIEEDEDPYTYLDNTQWAAKVQPNETEVPSTVRDHAYWLLEFTGKNFSLKLIDGNRIVLRYVYSGYYKLINRNELEAHVPGKNYIIRMTINEEENTLYTPDFGMVNFIKQ